MADCYEVVIRKVEYKTELVEADSAEEARLRGTYGQGCWTGRGRSEDRVVVAVTKLPMNLIDAPANQQQQEETHE